MYGGSVASGEIMRVATRRCPIGTGPALFGLSWDSGQASRRRSYTPILVSIANTDYNGKDACVCIGYMPVINVGAYSGSSKEEAVHQAMHELRQACIGAITDVIEASARHGFKCLLFEEDKYDEQ